MGVGENEEVQLFYLFVRLERNPNVNPLMFWLTGGPSCSTFSSFFYSNGSVMPQILGNPKLDSWPQVKGLTLRVTLIHADNQLKHLGFFFSFSVKCLILNKFIELRFTITYYFTFPKPTITLSHVHKYNKSTSHLLAQKLKYLQ